MAVNDDAVITAARGFIYTAPVDTPAPTPTVIDEFDPATGLTSPWVDLGHTARETLPEFGFDGGDTETRGTWRNEALRTIVTDPTVDYVTFQLHQFDDQAFELYYGVSNSSALQGVYAAAGASTSPPERALCIVVLDGDVSVGFWAAKASFRREEAVSLAVDQFAGFPVRATLLKSGAMDLFQWISLATGINPEGTPPGA